MFDFKIWHSSKLKSKVRMQVYILENSCRLSKITKDKSSDANLTSTWRSCFKLKCGPRVLRSTNAGLSKPAFDTSLSNSASHPTWVWVTPRSISSAGLSNLVLHFRRGSEKPHVSRQTRAWATSRSETPASTTSNARSASIARPVFLL